jgi:ABC-type enterobactin transport system, permease component
VRLERRTIGVVSLLLSACAVVSVVAMTVGDYPMSPGDVVRALFGIGSDPLAQFFVRDMRAPRVVLALAVGAALGVSGCIFQNLSRNPLGSPDITGFTTGAATGALFQIIIFGGGPLAIAAGALVGGMVTGVIVYFLSRIRGGDTTFVLVGIGVSFILQGVNSLLVVKASLAAAQTAAQWLAGSFNATTWAETVTVTGTLAVIIPLGLLMSRPLSVMMTGNDLAIGLGVGVGRTRVALVFIAVALVAVSVAAAGPIAFVALAAPQLARRLSRTSGPGMGASAVMGALLVVTSDLVAQRLFAPVQLPVGVITGSLGGIYLMWLLAREWRKERS